MLPTEVTGRSVFDLYRDSPAILDHVRRALAGEAFSATVEVGDEGATRVYETRYDPIVDPQGQVVEVVGVATDITERAAAERALRRSEAQLVEADRLASLGALAAGVAHEINNPLAYVLLNVDLVVRELERRGAAHADLAARLREARSGVERVRLIAQDLLAFSRVDTERRVPVDVRRVLDSSIDIASSEIRHKARLRRDYDDVPLVDADPSRLGQVFLNLLVNAAQAMDEGSGRPHEIRIHTGVDATGNVVVTITDTGSGIPRALLSRIFEPFFTTKPAGVGTGLGLAICRSIVSTLGGQINVESELGRGSTFRVVLPVPGRAAADARPVDDGGAPGKPGAAPPDPAHPAGGAKAGSPGGGSQGVVRKPEPRADEAAHATGPNRQAGPRLDEPGDAKSADGAELVKPAAAKRGRVLIIDDEPVLASALGRSIQSEFDVVVLSSGTDALDLLRRDDRFDVVLCDLIMPSVTGMDLHEELSRSRPALAERMIFMTGGSFTPRTRDFLRKVPNPTLDKPFDLATLSALLRRRAGS